MKNKAIGGFFELELRSSEPYHKGQGFIELNTARNGLELILREKKYKKIFLPIFSCEVLLEPVKKLNIEFEYYRIDENLEPALDFSLISNDSCLLYINYFGLKDSYVESLRGIEYNLIIDNAQSFFSKPVEFSDTIYSARKFFGVADGAYLYSKAINNYNLPVDLSFERMNHLMIRTEVDAEAGYKYFQEVEQSLSNLPIRTMSKLTQRILRSIDYNKIAADRLSNFHFLDENLRNRNLLKITKGDGQIPLVYPFWSHDLSLKRKLTENRVYTATYWPNVVSQVHSSTLESALAREVVHLPIDQRNTQKDLAFIVDLIS